MAKRPGDFQNSYLAKERGRVDIVGLDNDYAPDRNEALKHVNVYMQGDPVWDAVAIMNALLMHPKATTMFVNADLNRLEATWQYLLDNTGLDARLGTIGYNAQGITIYKRTK